MRIRSDAKTLAPSALHLFVASPGGAGGPRRMPVCSGTFGLYPISTMGLGIDSEYSLNLVPKPPQNKTTFIVSPFLRIERDRSGRSCLLSFSQITRTP